MVAKVIGHSNMARDFESFRFSFYYIKIWSVFFLLLSFDNSPLFLEIVLGIPLIR